MGDLLLIRHGQASFGAEDYDRLSPTGEAQSQRLGTWLREHAEPPALVARGQMRRHAQTAQRCMDAAALDAPMLTLPGLDELDHVELLRRHRPDLPDYDALSAELRRSDDPHRAFQAMFVAAVERWTAGGHDSDYARPWPLFRQHVLAALETLAERALDSVADVWVFTSGGPIAVIAGALFGVPPEHSFRLSWPLTNTGLTRVRPGRERHHVITFNAWPHLAGADSATLVTQR